MCSALDELVQEGIQQGILQGIQANIRTCKNFNINRDAVIKNIMKEFSLSEEMATEYVDKYW